MRKSDIESRYVTSFLSRRFARPFIYSVILALLGFCLASAYYSARAASTYVVVNVLDTGGACLPGPIPGCTLRQALTTAVTGDSITFAIPGVGPFTIMPASSLPTIIQGITIDGTTQPGGATCGPAFNLLIVIDGTSAPAGTIGLSFAAGSQGSIVKGIVVDNFTNDGILFQNSGSNTLTCSMIGTDPSGTIAQPNTGNGLWIFSGTNTTIGGTTPAERNIISGNGRQGINISNAGTNLNTVEGNYIGTDVTGTLPLANQFSGVDISNGAQGNRIGGTTLAERNIVSGNSSGGIGVHDLGTNNNFIEGNYVGTDVTGTLAVGNVFDGIAIFNNAQGNTVSGNLTSGNTWSGIAVSGAGTNGNIIVGNKVGTDATGMLALGNKLHGIVLFSGASNNTVNGNVASGNGTSNVYHGIAILGLGTNNNIVSGNFAGTNATGTAALGNVGCGVKIAFSPSGNTIGGTTPADRNILSGNLGCGVAIESASNNTVIGNYIGLNASGSAALGNQTSNAGIFGFGTSTNNRIGGTTAAERNVIAGSGVSGIRIHDAGTTGNVVEGNYIGTDPTGTSFAGFGNAVQGIDIYNGATGNTIGGTAPGAGNLVAGNGQNGIRVADVGTSANNVWGNLVGTNSGGTPLSNALNGILIDVGASANFIGGTAAGQGNTIAYNVGAGVLISTLGSNPVRGNSIYSNGALGINYTIPSGGIPVFTSAGTSGYNYQISGTLSATASTTYAIDFYASAVGDPSGSGQGQNYIGTATVTTDAAGNASFGPVTFPIVGGRAVLSATATGGSGSGDTSKFSVDATVILPNPPISASGGGSASGACLALTLTAPQQTVLMDEQVTLSATLTNNCGQALNNIVVIVQVGQPLTILSPNPNCRQVTFTIGTLNSGQQFIGSVLVSTRSVQSASVTTLPANVAQTDGRQLASFVRRPFAPQSMSALRVQTVVNVVEARWDDQNVRTASEALNVIPNGKLPGTGEHPAAAQPGTTPGVLGLAAFGLIVGLVTAALTRRGLKSRTVASKQ